MKKLNSMRGDYIEIFTHVHHKYEVPIYRFYIGCEKKAYTEKNDRKRV